MESNRGQSGAFYQMLLFLHTLNSVLCLYTAPRKMACGQSRKCLRSSVYWLIAQAMGSDSLGSNTSSAGGIYKFSILQCLLIAMRLNETTQVKDLRQCPYISVGSKWQVSIEVGVSCITRKGPDHCMVQPKEMLWL